MLGKNNRIPTPATSSQTVIYSSSCNIMVLLGELLHVLMNLFNLVFTHIQFTILFVVWQVIRYFHNILPLISECYDITAFSLQPLNGSLPIIISVCPMRCFNRCINIIVLVSNVTRPEAKTKPKTCNKLIHLNPDLRNRVFNYITNAVLLIVWSMLKQMYICFDVVRP